MAEQERALTPFPDECDTSAWHIMQQWQDFVHARPDDACAVALFDLMADMLLCCMAYTHQWTLQETLLYWYRILVPTITSGVEKRWDVDEEQA